MRLSAQAPVFYCVLGLISLALVAFSHPWFGVGKMMIVGIGPAVLVISLLVKSMTGLSTDSTGADLCLSAVVLQGSSLLRNFYRGEPRPYVAYRPWFSFKEFLFVSGILCFVGFVFWLVSLWFFTVANSKRTHSVGDKPDNAPLILWKRDPFTLHMFATVLGLATYFGQAFFILCTEPLGPQ